ncbi:hypothetical protein DFH11DRAFT_1613732 [Phellopilus nigrolimitatus]|nr:hypothetical protein DFH11DRAFT_1613732 [Phellopilus nigrolimitatus]
MWCTRWFLPLIILPLPTAPPFFLLVFLLSLFLQTRPCFYCMMLLTALFTSSCYWQALPVDAPLSKSSGNTTTFADAVRADFSASSLSTESILALPPVIQLLDRCWCNTFATGGLFEPTDVSAWEQASVRELQRDLEVKLKGKEEKERPRNSLGLNGEGCVDVDGEHASQIEAAAAVSSTSPEPTSYHLLFMLRRLWKPSDSILPTVPSDPKSDPTRVSLVEQDSQSEEPSSTSEMASASPSSQVPTNEEEGTHARVQILRRYYDFRPYGLDITVDFGWKR